MSKNYRITLFGKKGCDKCKVLKERIDKLVEQDDWKDFEKEYLDVESVDGLVSFVKMEVLNPLRIPSFIVKKLNLATNEYQALVNPEADNCSALSKPFRYVGIETDYSEKGHGIITPQMITKALSQAKSL